MNTSTDIIATEETFEFILSSSDYRKIFRTIVFANVVTYVGLGALSVFLKMNKEKAET